MPRATRSKPKAKEPTPEPPVSTIKPLPTPTTNPPKLFVLPKDTSKDARIVTFDNPATSTPSRYFFCPTRGFYEFTRIAAPKRECRSWLLTSTSHKDADAEDDEERIGSGYITKSADMFIATPIDILFFILPVLAPKGSSKEKQHFLALDDYTDRLAASSRHWKVLLAQYPSLVGMVEKRVKVVCDTVDACGETMYRLNLERVAAVLMKKAECMVAHGLPKSLEEKFVKSVLEVPVLSVAREESSLSGTALSTTEATESQTSADTTLTTPDEKPSSEEHPPTQPSLATPPEIPALLRLRTSLTYLTDTYLASPLSSLLAPSLSAPFPTLDAHLSALAQLKQEASTLRSISDNISRKRAVAEDDDRLAEREMKKRKKEEDEKKKKAEGRGIKQLKKVDTSGMKKMSAFFVKVDKK